MSNIFIYGLVDPTSELIVYVGKTVGSLQTRLNGHEYKARSGRCKTPCGDWIRGLQVEGKRPKIIPLEKVDGRWQDAERAWIQKLRELGTKLLNLHPGGNGAHTREPLPPEFILLLGTISDGQIAKKAGLARETITYHRNCLGIKRAPVDPSRMKNTFQKGLVPHNKVPVPEVALPFLGKVGDRQLAVEFGITRALLRKKRAELGIPAFKGRYIPSGVCHHNSKLTPEAVRDIRGSYVRYSKDHNMQTLAIKHGVDQTTISDVLHYKIWKDVK